MDDLYFKIMVTYTFLVVFLTFLAEASPEPKNEFFGTKCRKIVYMEK